MSLANKNENISCAQELYKKTSLLHAMPISAEWDVSLTPIIDPIMSVLGNYFCELYKLI